MKAASHASAGLERAGAASARHVPTPAKNDQVARSNPAENTPAKNTPAKSIYVTTTPARRELEFGQAGRGRLGAPGSATKVPVKQARAMGKKAASGTQQATPGPASQPISIDLAQQQVALESALAENAWLLDDIAQLRSKLAAQSQQRAELAARLDHVEVARAGLRSAADEAIRALEAESGAAAVREEELALAVGKRAEAAAAVDTKVAPLEPVSDPRQEDVRELERGLLAARAGTTGARMHDLRADTARGHGEERATDGTREHASPTAQDVQKPAVLEIKGATAVIERLLTRYQERDAALAGLRADVVEKSLAVERTQLIVEETASQLQDLKRENEALLARAKAPPSPPLSPSSPLVIGQLDEAREKALAQSAGLASDLANCRAALAAKEQECAALSAQLAQLKRERAALLRMADEALSAVEEGRPAAAAQRAQLEERARESERAAAAAEARVLNLESSLAAASSWVAELEEEADRLKVVQAAAAAQLKAERIAAATERNAAAAREGGLREEKAELEADSALLREEVDTLRAESRAQMALTLAEQGRREKGTAELERATRRVAELEEEVRAFKSQVVKLKRELKEAAASPAPPDADELQLQVSSLRQLAADLASKVNDATAAAESAQGRFIVMESYLKDQLTQERLRADTLQNDLNVKNDELERVKQRAQALTAQRNLSASEREKRLIEQVRRLTDQIQEANAQVGQMLAGLQFQNPATAPDLPNMMRELERLREQLGDARGDAGGSSASVVPAPETSEASKRAVQAYPDVVPSGWPKASRGV